VLGYFQTLRPLRRPPAPLAGVSSRWPTVDVLIPTFNERLETVRATVLGALALEYPECRFNVFLLDDACRREFRQFARAVGACYLTSEYRTHSKADQINEALARTSGELVAIFDCDQVPARSFLQTTVGWFQRDRRLGLVQTPHHFYSPDPFERNLDQFHRVPNEAALFHRLVQDGNDLWNASLCCGSCAVLRRDALEDIGGIAITTVSEDAHTAVRMQRLGWMTAYVNVPQAAGPATGSLSAYIAGRSRSSRGVMQILRLENPLFSRGLTLPQRLCFLSATMHGLLALPRLIFLTMPLTYLLFGVVNFYGDAVALVAYVLPSLALARITTNRIQRGVRSAFWNAIYETVLAPYTVVAALRALCASRVPRAPAGVPLVVTARPDVVLRPPRRLAACGVAGAQRRGGDRRIAPRSD
jgi:cellulose synthase (UDP-forming)